MSISGGLRVGYLSNASGVKTISDNQSSGNTVNFNVVEDLGGGLAFTGSTQLRYRADSGDNTNAAAVAGGVQSTATAPLFQLVAIGVKGSFGHIQAGRIGLDQFWGYSPFGSNGAHANPSANGGQTEDGQWRYTSPSFNGFNVVVAGAVKGNTTASTQDAKQVLINYVNGPLAVTALSEEAGSGVKASGVGASYDFGVAKLSVINATDTSTANAKTGGTMVGVWVPMGTMTFKAAFKNAKNATTDKTTVGVDYALSKRTILEADAYKVKGDAKTSYWMGVRHSF